MGKLQELYDRLGNQSVCSIALEPAKTGQKEVLTLKKSKTPEETITIQEVEEGILRITYEGKPYDMQQTLRELRLPNSIPTNLGEKVFYIFRGILQNEKDPKTPLQQDIVAGKEHQLDFVLKKLIACYNN